MSKKFEVEELRVFARPGVFLKDSIRDAVEAALSLDIKVVLRHNENLIEIDPSSIPLIVDDAVEKLYDSVKKGEKNDNEIQNSQ